MVWMNGTAGLLGTLGSGPAIMGDGDESQRHGGGLADGSRFE
jgi:hypothetical protein